MRFRARNVKRKIESIPPVEDDVVSEPQPPTPVARRFVRYLVGFGVAVGVGCAPFLGTLDVPGFTALPELFPDSLQDRFVTLSPFLMGLVALAVEFYAGERLTYSGLRRWFRNTLWVVGAAFLALVVIYTFVVVEVPYSQGEKTARVVIGFERLAGCDCPPVMSNAQCLKQNLDPARVERCWDARVVRSFELLLTLAYLTLIGGFATLIGLLTLRDVKRREQEEKKAAT